MKHPFNFIFSNGILSDWQGFGAHLKTLSTNRGEKQHDDTLSEAHVSRPQSDSRNLLGAFGTISPLSFYIFLNKKFLPESKISSTNDITKIFDIFHGLITPSRWLSFI